MRRRSTFSLTVPSTPRVGYRPGPLPPGPRPHPSTKCPGPCRSPRGTRRRLYASARLAVGDTISACAVDCADESAVDGVPDVLIIPGMDISPLLASSLTLSITLSRVLFCFSVNRSS